MKCRECGAGMKVTHESRSYEEGGLAHVLIMGVEVRRCPKCGEEEVVIPRLAALHRTLAHALSLKEQRLVGAEVRFLRKYLGFDQEMFAKMIGVTPSTVSRWENDHEPMGPQADRVLRLAVATREPVAEYPLEALSKIADERAPTKLHARRSGEGWSTHA